MGTLYVSTKKTIAKTAQEMIKNLIGGDLIIFTNFKNRNNECNH